MDYSFPHSRILLLAREPVPGLVKTRLQPVLGADRTLALHCDLIRYCWRNLRAAAVAPVELWVSGDPRHPLFLELEDSCVHPQQGEDLGQRMAMAAEDALQRAESVLLVGADCPAVGPDSLLRASRLLAEGREVVLGPAEDGGYVLLGLRKATGGGVADLLKEALFRNIPWGTGTVFRDTVNRLEQRACDYGVLDRCWDVDRPEDLPRLRRLSPLFAQY